MNSAHYLQINLAIALFLIISVLAVQYQQRIPSEGEKEAAQLKGRRTD